MEGLRNQMGLHKSCWSNTFTSPNYARPLVVSAFIGVGDESLSCCIAPIPIIDSTIVLPDPEVICTERGQKNSGVRPSLLDVDVTSNNIKCHDRIIALNFHCFNGGMEANSAQVTFDHGFFDGVCGIIVSNIKLAFVVHDDDLHDFASKCKDLSRAVVADNEGCVWRIHLIESFAIWA